MLRQLLFAAGCAACIAVIPSTPNAMAAEGSPAWRASGESPLRPVAPPANSGVDRSNAARGSVNPTGLPNDAGQVWRDYDISSYTARVTSTKRPEQALVDWILLETGYEAWHTEPLGILSAGPRTLRVYHTPDMQRIVADLVARFTGSEAATYTFSTRVVSLDTPSWRTSAQRLLRSVPVKTSGISAWVLAREDAAVLLGEIRRRSDYREHNSPYLMVNNGQSTLISTMRGRYYVREIVTRPNVASGFEPVTAQVDEGFALDFSPLLTVDRRMIDATIKCEINQVEKMVPAVIEVPTQVSPRQRTEIEVPQMSHYRFHERFRWPVDQVLIVGLGMVALPVPVNGSSSLLPLLGSSPARADLLIFVECKGRPTSAANAPSSTRSPVREAKNYRGRY